MLPNDVIQKTRPELSSKRVYYFKLVLVFRNLDELKERYKFLLIVKVYFITNLPFTIVVSSHQALPQPAPSLEGNMLTDLQKNCQLRP